MLIRKDIKDRPFNPIESFLAGQILYKARVDRSKSVEIVSWTLHPYPRTRLDRPTLLFRTDLIFRPKSPKARWRYYGKKALRHERMKDARAEKAALNTGRAWKKKAQ